MAEALSKGKLHITEWNDVHCFLMTRMHSFDKINFDVGATYYQFGGVQDRPTYTCKFRCVLYEIPCIILGRS